MTPQLAKSSILEILHDDADTRLPGCRNLKKGKYVILSVEMSFLGKDQVYVIRSARSNATYEWRIDHVAIDKAVADGAIRIHTRTQRQ